MTAPWLGHENLCSLQWSTPPCNCPCPSCGVPLDMFPGDGCKQSEHNARPATEPGGPRPADDPWIPTCDGRNCGGQPHE